MGRRRGDPKKARQLEEFYRVAAQRLKKVIETSGRSQRAIAIKMGISPSMLTRILRSGSRLTMENISSAASALGLQPLELARMVWPAPEPVDVSSLTSASGRTLEAFLRQKARSITQDEIEALRAIQRSCRLEWLTANLSFWQDVWRVLRSHTRE